MKTNGARFLESLGIPFELREYEVDPERSLRHHGREKDRHARRAGLQNAAHHRRRARIRLRRHPRRRRTRLQETRAPRRLAQSRDGSAQRRAAAHRLHPRRRHHLRREKALPRLRRRNRRFSSTRISVSAGTRGTQLILTPDDYLRAAAALGERRVQDRSTSTQRRPTQLHPRADPTQRASHDPRPLDPSRQRSPHRVAHARRHDLHALLLRPRRRALLHRLRSARRILAADRRRRALRGHHVRLGQRAQPGLGTRNPPPGHGRAAHGPLAGRRALPRQGHRQLSLRHHRAGHPRALLLHLLQPAHRRPRPGCWRWFCRSAPGRWSATESSSPRSP